VLRGKRVAVLEPATYGGHKDVNEAWIAGVMTVGDWPAAEAVGATAARWAWACVPHQPQQEER